MPDYPLLDPCHCVNFRRTGSAVTDFYTRMLKPCGLSLPQFALLKNLSAIENCSTTDLSRRMRLEHSTLVRNLQTMQEMGMIHNEREAGRKLSVWRLTDTGRMTLEKGLPLWQKAQETIERTLGGDNLAMLRAMLVRLQRLEEKGA